MERYSVSLWHGEGISLAYVVSDVEGCWEIVETFSSRRHGTAFMREALEYARKRNAEQSESDSIASEY